MNRSAFQITLAGVVAVSALVSLVAGIALHLWTVWHIFHTSGPLLAVLALFLPPFPELILFWLDVKHGFFSVYEWCCLSWLLVGAIGHYGGAIFAERSEEPIAPAS